MKVWSYRHILLAIVIGIGLGVAGDRVASDPSSGIGARRSADACEEQLRSLRADAQRAFFPELREGEREQLARDLAQRISQHLVPKLSNALRADTRALAGIASGDPGRRLDDVSLAEPGTGAEATAAASDRRKAEARLILDSALRTGTWNESDAREFRQALGQMEKRDQEETLRAFARAVNNGEIEVTTSGPPF